MQPKPALRHHGSGPDAEMLAASLAAERHRFRIFDALRSWNRILDSIRPRPALLLSHFGIISNKSKMLLNSIGSLPLP